MGGKHHGSHALRSEAGIDDLSALNQVLTKLGAARTRLILEKPFIGALVMHLPLRAADAAWCDSVATDARTFYFNPEYVASLTFGQTQFILAHEAMHCALAHFARRHHRVRRRWDIACDHAVNLLLADEGLHPPPGALANPGFRGLSAEEIYPLIPPDTQERTLDRHLFEENQRRPTVSASGSVGGESNALHNEPAASAAGNADAGWDDAGDECAMAERPAQGESGVVAPLGDDELARRWQGRLASAAQQARQAGRLSESWLRLIDGLIQPQIPWRSVLARFLMSVARDDYSFQRPSRRDDAALLPRLASAGIDLHVVLDTSGSVAAEELAQFVTEVDALKGQVRARVTLHACDERLDARGPWTFEPWEVIKLPEGLSGGGGTRFLPVFEWLAAERRRPDLLVYFTDAAGEFPEQMPAYPVVWLVKGRGTVPWGDRIQLN